MLLLRFGFNLYPILEQIGDKPDVAGRKRGDALAIGGDRLQGAAFNGYLVNMTLPDFIEELRIIQLYLRGLLLARIELVEYGHQHQSDDQPDSDTLE